MAFSISGLSGSGLDTAELVKGMMDAERVPYKNLTARKEKLGMEQQVFRQINTKLNALNNSLADLKYSFTLQAFKATSSSDAIKASTTDEAVAGSYTLNVQQAAVSAKAKTTGADLMQAAKDGTLKIGSGPDRLDFSDATLRSQLGLDDAPVGEELLKKIVNHVNANSEKAGTNVSMLKNGSDFELMFTSKTPDAVVADGVTLSGVTTGQQAIFSINGTSFTRNSNEIKDIIPGVSFTIGSNVKVNEDISLTVSADTDKIADKVQKFVDAYNDLITSVRTNLAMPDDVEKTVNPLQGDTVLKDINSRLYDTFNQLTNAGFLEDIGLSIDKGVSSAKSLTGKITFDKEAFKTALTDNPTKATTILTSVAQDMSDTISKSWTSSSTGVMAVKIEGYDADLKRADERLEAMDRMLQMKEARYKQQFDAMEIMLGSLNSTQKWLTSQFDNMMKANKS